VCGEARRACHEFFDYLVRASGKSDLTRIDQVQLIRSSISTPFHSGFGVVRKGYHKHLRAFSIKSRTDQIVQNTISELYLFVNNSAVPSAFYSKTLTFAVATPRNPCGHGCTFKVWIFSG
jgi:hypothetical protein